MATEESHSEKPFGIPRRPPINPNEKRLCAPALLKSIPRLIPFFYPTFVDFVLYCQFRFLVVYSVWWQRLLAIYMMVFQTCWIGIDTNYNETRRCKITRQYSTGNHANYRALEFCKTVRYVFCRNKRGKINSKNVTRGAHRTKPKERKENCTSQ